jgi:recombinase-like zinc beta ribbon protein/recombinase/resolvase-like protein
LRAEGRLVVVVVAALDRFGRRLVERVRAREELKALGVATHSVRDGGEVSDLVANVLAGVAEEEVRRLGERVRAAKTHVKSGGWHPLGRPAWGYRLRPASPDERADGAPKSVLEPDPDTAPFVAEAFSRAAAGASVRAVVAWLGKLPSASRGGRTLTYAVVRKLLSSPVYLGYLSDDPTVPRGRWPSIVEENTWLRVQEGIARHTRLPRQATGRYLLSGMLRCPRCSARMSGWLRKSRPPNYRCNGYLRGAAAPDAHCVTVVPAPALDAAVLAEVSKLIERLVADVAFVADLRRAWGRLNRPAGDNASRLRSLQREAARLRGRLTRAAEMFVDGQLDRKGHDGLRSKAETDLDDIAAELERLAGTPRTAAPLPSLDTVLAQLEGWSRALAGADVSARRDVLTPLVEHVTPVRTGYGHYEVALTWTPLGEFLLPQRIPDGIGWTA